LLDTVISNGNRLKLRPEQGDTKCGNREHDA
jgi:hypothetical protein